MDITKFRILHDNVLVKTFEIEKKDGIVKPSSYEDKPELGEVISKGPGHWLECGQLIEVEVDKGETVLFNKYSATKFNLDGYDYFIVRAEDIVGAR